MVKHGAALDEVFKSLGDATRRDILRRVALAGQAKRELSVNEVALPYHVSLAAISKHLMVLERAKLIRKRRRGKQLFVALSPPAFKNASEYLRHYQKLWEDRFDRLDDYLKTQK